MCTCEIQRVEETLARWLRRDQITPVMITAANNKYSSNNKAGQSGSSGQITELLNKDISSNCFFRKVLCSTEQGHIVFVRLTST